MHTHKHIEMEIPAYMYNKHKAMYDLHFLFKLSKLHFLCLQSYFQGISNRFWWHKECLPARASEQGNVIGSVRIGECGSTLYVGLSRIVRNLIQKSTV